MNQYQKKEMIEYALFKLEELGQLDAITKKLVLKDPLAMIERLKQVDLFVVVQIKSDRCRF